MIAPGNFNVLRNRTTCFYPYVRLDNQPDNSNRISRVFVDQELAREAFTFTLESGIEETVHIDQVLDYNRDPGYLNDMVIYKLTIEVKRRVAVSPLSKRSER
jgi:hypothetical protein